MFHRRNPGARVISAIVVFSVVTAGLAVFPQDLVAMDDLSTGSSVFVFRGSRKRAQGKASAGMGFVSRGGSNVVGRRRIDSGQVAAARKRRTGTTASSTRPRTPPANAKLRLSESLTAKADGLLDANQTDQAIDAYREALRNNPNNATAKLGLSSALTSKGIDLAGEKNSEAGVVYLQEAITLDPRNFLATAKLGEIYDNGGQTERAIQSYEKTLEIEPSFAHVYTPLGMAYLKTGNIAKADTYAAKVRSSGDRSAAAVYFSGLVYHKQGRDAEALADFQAALALDPTLSSARYYEAVSYERLNQTDRSVASYKKTVELDPAFAPAWYDLGAAAYNAGDYATAETAYKEAIKGDPSNANAHLNLAGTYRQMERYAEANAEYAIAAQTIKNDPDLYSDWGFCLGKVNEWDRSAMRLVAARELGQTAIDESNVGWAYYNAANAAKAKNDQAAMAANLELGKAFLLKAVEKDPRLDAALLNLGSTHNALGEFQLAVNVLRTVVNLRNDWIIAMNQLGVGYRGLGDLQTAISQFQRVTTLDANNVYGLFNLGEAYNAAGNKKEAKKIQERLKRIDPTTAGRLDSILSGKAIVDETRRKIESKVPRIPRIPY